MIPSDTSQWEGMWYFSFTKGTICWGHKWQEWTGNFATRIRICKVCKGEEIGHHVL